MSVRLGDGRVVTFSNAENAHFDHGYAVTSHSAQGLTADRALVNVDASVHLDLINSRFSYVSVSRASLDATVCANNAASLGMDLAREVGKSAAMQLSLGDWTIGHGLGPGTQPLACAFSQAVDRRSRPNMLTSLHLFIAMPKVIHPKKLSLWVHLRCMLLCRIMRCDMTLMLIQSREGRSNPK
jgi:hypothetical protein